MKQKAGPAAIIIGVVVAVIFCIVVFRWAFAPQSPPASKDFMPDYAKARAVKPGEEGKGSASAGADSSSSSSPAYGTGYQQRGGAAGGPGGRPSYAGH